MKREGEAPIDAESRDSRGQDYITIDTKERYGRGLRWKLGLDTTPCIRSRKGKRCSFCGFLNHHGQVSPHEVGQVFNSVFRNGNLSDVHRIEIYVSGSFFDDEEVSFNSRLEIIESIAETGIEEVVLESRPEFTTEENLQALANAIEPGRITIAVGVETTDDNLRRGLSKDFSMKDLTGSMDRIARAGMNFQAYLLLKPPAISSDRDAVIDVIQSSRTIMGLTRRMNCTLTLAIQPFFLARNSAVAQEALKGGHIRPPWLYTVALTLKLLDAMRARDGMGCRVVLGNEVDNVDIVLASSNYGDDGSVCSCSEGIREFLRAVNISRDKLEESVDSVLGSQCRCKTAWQREIGSTFGESLSVGQSA
ncbi:MAG: hypothetical protein V3R87_01810 [Dehalococcoidia bacterium]